MTVLRELPQIIEVEPAAMPLSPVESKAQRAYWHTLMTGAVDNREQGRCCFCAAILHQFGDVTCCNPRCWQEWGNLPQPRQEALLAVPDPAVVARMARQLRELHGDAL